MKKIFAILVPIIIIIGNIQSYAQYTVTTVQGNIFNAVIIYEDDYYVQFRTLDNIKLHLNRKVISSMSKSESSVEIQSGNVYHGHISEINNSGLKIIVKDSSTVKLLWGDIRKINGINKIIRNYEESKGNYYGYMEDYEEEKKSHDYLTLGSTFGFPCAISLQVGFQGKDYGFKASAGHAIFYYNYQVNLLYRLKKTENVEQRISTGFGYLYGIMVEKNPAYYGGVFYDVNYYGLYAEIGVIALTGTKMPIAPSFALGFVNLLD